MQIAIAQLQTALITLLLTAVPITGMSGDLPVQIAQNTDLRASTFKSASAYTDKALPTLRRGNRGNDVKKLQQILLDNGFLSAASAMLKTGTKGVAIDGIFGQTTESAVRDLQQRYKLRVNGVVTSATWKTLDVSENPYRSSLPWKI